MRLANLIERTDPRLCFRPEPVVPTGAYEIYKCSIKLVDDSADKWNSEQSQQTGPNRMFSGFARFSPVLKAHAMLPQEDGIVRYAVKTLLVVFVLTLAFAAQAMAANYIVIVDIADGANAKDIA